MPKNLQAEPYTTWQLIKAYWQSEQKVSAYFLFSTLLVLALLLVGTQVAITNWYNAFYNSLQKYDLRSVMDLMWVFVFIATVHVILNVYNYYVQSFLGLRWRRWLTEQFLSRWIQKKGYYYLEHFDENTDNPDQRIQEDIASLVSFSLDLVLGLFSSIITIFSFIVVLWKLSGVITLSLGALGVWHIPGYLVWVSIVYATIGSVLTLKIGFPLIHLNFQQQRKEADFRYAAVDLRTHAENVALYRGERHQHGVLNRLLIALLDNMYMIILRQKMLLWFTGTYNQVSVLVPLAVALPNYFKKVFELGGLMQTIAAFDRIQSALSFLVNAYTRIAEWRAINERLLGFLNHIYESEQRAKQCDALVFSPSDDNSISIKNTTLNTPNGQCLLSGMDITLYPKDTYWIKGDSGIGKSTLVRAIAGIWPYGKGEIRLPSKKNIMFVPQRLYMPLGNLKEALLFPNVLMAPVTDEELVRLLLACDLPDLTHQLHEVHKWSELLSPGELQRIAFVRVILQKPDWVFLDESTSALDLAHEKMLYQLLKTELPRCTLVSIGHRPSLSDYHSQVIDMSQYVSVNTRDFVKN